MCELACLRWHHLGTPYKPSRLHRGQARLPHWTALTQDFLACWYSGITFGIAACNEAIRLSEAG